MTPSIRSARADDLAALRDIEGAAGEAFRGLGMDAVADDEPPTLDDLGGYQRSGRCWVAVDEDDRPVAYVIVSVVDGTAHIEQVSVHPRSSRRGLGRQLIDTVAEWASCQGLDAVTLTTFADVPWNAPYYGRLGFRVVPDGELSAGLRDIRAREAAEGLDRWPRVVMVRTLTRS